jgi:hypothetical protein
MRTLQILSTLIAVVVVVGCAVPEPRSQGSAHLGAPTIRDIDGRITGYIDERPPGPTYIRDADGRIKGTIDRAPAGPTYIRDTDGRIRSVID